MKNEYELTPPRNTQRILRWGDLPPGSDPATYELTTEHDDTIVFTLKKGNRRVFEGLMRAPMYCASPVRTSERVMTLKRDYGVPIRTDLFDGNGTTECERFGVYFLDGHVRRIGDEQSKVGA